MTSTSNLPETDASRVAENVQRAKPPEMIAHEIDIESVRDAGIQTVERKLAADRKSIVDKFLRLILWTFWVEVSGCLLLLALVAVNPAATELVIKILEKELPAVVDFNARMFYPVLALTLGWYFGRNGR